MPISMYLSRILIYGLPLSFVVISWGVSAGLPYYLDNNETYLSYLHARNLEIWNPNEYGWLTAAATDPLSPTSENFYSHNPNGPRYLHYVLLRVGIRELSTQVLIISVVTTGLTVALLWRLFGQPALLVVPLAVVLDYAGFLAWTVNTYRAWTFVLFFGLILTVVKRRVLWTGALMFLLFQVEYGFAFFVGVTAGLMALLTHRKQAWPLIVAMALGAALSLAVFAIQVLAFYGWDGFLHELAATYQRRGTVGESSGVLRYLYQAWHGPLLLLNMVARDTHNMVVFMMVLWGVLSSALALRRASLSEPHRFLATLTVSVAVATVATSTILYGYFVDGFVVSLLPLATFLVAPALGVVALELESILGRLVRWPYRSALVASVVLLPLMAGSIAHYRPPVAVELFRRLQTEYHGEAVVAANLGPWHFNPELAFTLTDGRGLRTSDLDLTPADAVRFDAARDAGGSLTYVCLDTLYLRDIAKPGVQNLCDLAVARMVPRGDRVVAEGTGWAIMRVEREGEVSAR